VTPYLLPIASKRTSDGDLIAIYRSRNGGLVYVPAIARWRGAATRRVRQPTGLWLDDSPL